MKATNRIILFVALSCGAFTSSTILAQVPVRNETPQGWSAGNHHDAPCLSRSRSV